jgi:hypothetical protein
MPKYRRTGTVPGKKNYPAYGGIGARNVALANKIAAQATPRNTTITDTSNTSDNLDNTNILFNKSTFDKNFMINGDGWPEGSPEAGNPIGPGYFFPLPDKLKNALINAVNRWSRFLKFQKNTINYIKIDKPTWKGIELLKCRYLADFQTGSASCETVLYENTTINHGFYLSIKKAILDNLNITQLSSIITHELGHALGMPCFTSYADGIISNPQLLPLIETIPTEYDVKYYNNATFPLTIIAYAKYSEFTGSPITRIPLERSGSEATKNAHWEDNTYYDASFNLYRGFKNELMVGTWNSSIDSSFKYLISRVTITLLLRLYTIFNSREYYNYEEINPGSSEDTSSEIVDETAIDPFDLKTGVILLKGVIAPYTLDRSIDFTREINQEPNSIKLNCDCSPVYTKHLLFNFP